MKNIKIRKLSILFVISIFFLTGLQINNVSAAEENYNTSVSSIHGQEIVLYGNDVTLTWDVPYTDSSNQWVTVKHYSKIYYSCNDGSWVHMSTIWGCESQSYQKSISTVGLWKFKVEVWIQETVKSWGMTYNRRKGYEFSNIIRCTLGSSQGNIQVDEEHLGKNDKTTITWNVGYTDISTPHYFESYYSKIFFSYDNEGWISHDPPILEGTGDKHTERKLSEWGYYQCKIEIWCNYGVPGQSSYENYQETLSISFLCESVNVDIKIAYDEYVANYLDSIYKNHSILADSVETALDDGFGQYWDIDFHTGTTNEWLIYDEDGYHPNSLPNPSEYFKWAEKFCINWDEDRSLPENEGHGDDFDLLFLFVYDTDQINILGVTEYTLGDVILIILNNINSIEDWNSEGIVGAYSVFMHEVGHAYGINGEGVFSSGEDQDGLEPDTGDTNKKRNSIMDYYWGFHGYWNIFDQGHRDTITSNIDVHSF